MGLQLWLGRRKAKSVRECMTTNISPRRLIAGVIPLLGADAAAHMSEELEDASYSLPRAMMYSTLANGALCLIMIISYCYCIGDILDGKPTTQSNKSLGTCAL